MRHALCSTSPATAFRLVVSCLAMLLSSEPTRAATSIGTPQVKLVAGIGQVVLTWDQVTGADSYHVYVGTAANGEPATPDMSVPTAYAVIPGLAAGIPFFFKVKAVSGSTEGPPSDEITGTAQTADKAAAQDLTATAAQSAVTLTWTSLGAHSYQIFQGTAQDAEGADPVLTVTPTADPKVTATLQNLPGGHQYFFKVKALTLGVTGPASKEASVTVAASDSNAGPTDSVQAFFQLGASLLNPYHLTTTAPLSIAPAGSTDANAFLEFVYTDRLAWNGTRIKEWLTEASAEHRPPGDPIWMWTKRVSLDVQARIGYTFANGSTPSANTIVGSGNFDGELSVGMPFVLVSSPDGVHDFTVGLEAGYSAVTERSALRAHQSWFAGLAYNTAFQDPMGATDSKGTTRRVLLNFRLLYASIDTIRYVSDSDTQIYAVNGNLPHYFSKWTDAFQTELMYPLNKSSFVTFSGRVYPNVTPGLWSIQIGLSTSFSSLVDAFFK